MGVGYGGLVRLKGWGKEGTGSQQWMGLRMERKKEKENRGRKTGGKETSRECEKEIKAERQRWMVDTEKKNRGRGRERDIYIIEKGGKAETGRATKTQ